VPEVSFTSKSIGIVMSFPAVRNFLILSFVMMRTILSKVLVEAKTSPCGAVV